MKHTASALVTEITKPSRLGAEHPRTPPSRTYNQVKYGGFSLEQSSRGGAYVYVSYLKSVLTLDSSCPSSNLFVSLMLQVAN